MEYRKHQIKAFKDWVHRGLQGSVEYGKYAEPCRLTWFISLVFISSSQKLKILLFSLSTPICSHILIVKKLLLPSRHFQGNSAIELFSSITLTIQRKQRTARAGQNRRLGWSSRGCYHITSQSAYNRWKENLQNFEF